jgi:hypothetical protein
MGSGSLVKVIEKGISFCTDTGLSRIRQAYRYRTYTNERLTQLNSTQLLLVYVPVYRYTTVYYVPVDDWSMKK